MTIHNIDGSYVGGKAEEASDIQNTEIISTDGGAALSAFFMENLTPELRADMAACSAKIAAVTAPASNNGTDLLSSDISQAS